MKEKKHITTGKFIIEIICGVFVYGILLMILLGIVTSLLTPLLLKSTILAVIIPIILSILTACLSWKLAVSSVIKKNTTDRANINSIVKGIVIILILMFICSVGWDIYECESSVNKLNTQLESLSNSKYANEALIIASKEKLKEVRTINYITLGINCLITPVVYFGIGKYVKYRLENELES